jgi:glycogen operon protein
MTKADWDDGTSRRLGMFLNGEEIVTPDERGRRIVDDSFVLLFNAAHEDAEFTLPPQRFGARYTCELRTDGAQPATHEAGQQVSVASRSLVLLRRVAT